MVPTHNSVPRPTTNLLGLSSHTKSYSTGGTENKYQTYTTTQRAGTIPFPATQVVYTQQPQTQTQSRPQYHHQPHTFMAQPTQYTSNRYAYVTPSATQPTGSTVVMTPTGQTYYTTSGVARAATPFPAAVQRIRGGAAPLESHGGGVHRPDASRRSRDQSAPPPGTHTSSNRSTRPPPDSDSSDDEYPNTGPPPAHPYGAPISTPLHVPRVVSTNTGSTAATAPVRPIMRKRTASSASAASVHFTPDNLFLTFPSPHTIKLSNIPRFGSQALMRAIREKVITMWLPGITFQKEGRGEYIVGFAGLSDGAMEPRGYNGHDNGLSDSDRKNWGLWTARGAEGIAALRLLTTLFSTFAAQGFSYLASLHCLPPQVIFTTTPADNSSRFLAMEITVAPLPRKKQKVHVTDPDSGDFILSKKVKVDISHISVRCVDFPEDVLRAVVGAVRNTGREGSGLHTKVPPKRESGKGYDTDGDEAARSELLHFGVQGERWDMKGVYVLDSVICRGTGKRAVSRKEIARSRAEKAQHPTMPQVIDADTDTLPVLLSHILKALSSNGFRLESSIPLPLPVPLVDPFSPFGSHHGGGGFSSFINGVLGGDSDAPRKGHGREVWMFRSVGWFEDMDD
ncbi:hypothetical protein FRB99_007189 [Tulasnella sp. 403]|nr:hypothetical protein FRB99_007189 [Tulasnella sp. 403]